ncbi:MerR family transcriptional regulator [Pseudomonas mangiferae]|uniref:MerR family transcriptional regulator n=1 Tax=Pseudomonas mangiferae TaxID=2593654 RepID=A0A553GW92_9PSED|nr:MerR family transcriptional regulator [Pseudomonas mangiferae]TRX73733.1 MerR family transcriptional regulator [Pseudomonas mangiferae]
MYIGKAAKLSGTTVKSIRHYEEIGLIPQPQREGKYRIYSQESVEVLRFIKCAQQLGFKLKELQGILRDYSGQAFPWELAQREVQRKKKELLTQIGSMQQLYQGLLDFEENLKDAREECPLERQLAQAEKSLVAGHL